MLNVSVLIHDDPGQAARLRASEDLAHALAAHLSCIDIVATPELIAAAGGGWVATAFAQRDTLIERRHAERVRSDLVARGEEFEWCERKGDLIDQLADAARLADVVVVNSLLGSGDYPDMLELARGLLVRISAAVVAVPEAATGFNAGGDAVILWDGSRHAQAALVAAVPMLARARQVHLAYAEDGSLGEPLRTAVQYLARERIYAHVCEVPLLGRSAADALEQLIRRRSPAYVVMGGWGHSRAHEMLFGGVTRCFLSSSAVPLVLARAK